MAGFLDDLSGLLGGGGNGGGTQRAAGGMTDFGSLADPSSTVKNVLATLRSAGSGAANPQQQQQAMQGVAPAGASASPGGMPAGTVGLNPTVSAFAAGMANQRPGQSGGSAFLSGLAGALGGKQNAEIQNQKLALEQQQWQLEAQKQTLAINAAKKQAEAMEKFDKDNGGGSGGYPAWYGGTGAGGPPPAGGAPPQAPPSPSDGGGGQPSAMPTPIPGPSPQAGGVAPSPSPAPQPSNGAPATPGVGPVSAPGPSPQAPLSGPMPPAGGAPSPAAMPQGGPAPTPQPPQGGSPAPQAPPPVVPPQMSSTPQFWQRVGPEQNPEFLRARAARTMNILQSNPYLPEQMQKNLQTQMSQDNATAGQIMQSGQVMVGGRAYMVPGIAENDATKKAMETSATEHAKNVENFNTQEQVTDSGSKFKPNPNGPAPVAPQQTGNPGQLPGAPQPTPAAPAPTSGASQQSTSTVDPETAQVKTAIPQAPAGGGFTHDPSLPAGAAQLGQSPLNKSRSETDGKIMEDMATTAPQIETAIERASAVSQAFKLFTSGVGAEKIANAKLIAQAAHAPDWVQNGISSGDPAALQWVAKEGVPTAFSIVRAGLPPGSRAAQQEFRVSEQKATPNSETTPQANHENVSEMMGELQYKRQFAQDWAQAQQQGWQSVSAFQTQWAKANKPADFVRAAQRQIGNYAGMPTPSPHDMAAGSVYVYDPASVPEAKRALYAQMGVTKPGQLFRWNGKAGGTKPLEPLDTSNGQGFNIR